MTCERPGIRLGLIVLAACRSSVPSTVQADRIEPRIAIASSSTASAPAVGRLDADQDRSMVPIESDFTVALDADAGSEQSPRAGCKGKPVRLPRLWEDAYTLSRNAVADGASITAIGRVRKINDHMALLDAVCRPYGEELLVNFSKPPCGAVGDILVVRGVARSFDFVTELSTADGPAVMLADSVVLGTTTVQEVCRARKPR